MQKAYYIVARTKTKRAEIVGPFKKESDAESCREMVAQEMLTIHPDQAGVATFTVEEGEPSPHGRRRGTKNMLLGYRSCLSGWVHLD